jgi:hypothetical protein
VLEPLAAAGKTAAIPPRSNRSSPRNYDRELCGARHLVENFLAKIKQFRAIATRYEKTARNYGKLQIHRFFAFPAHRARKRWPLHDGISAVSNRNG